MSHSPMLARLALLAALALPAAAQTAVGQTVATPAPDADTRNLIDRLRPENAMRGIRMPGADPAPPAPATGDSAQPPLAALPVPQPARETTAPAGTAAVSLTVNFPTGSAVLTPQAAAALGSLGRALSSAELAPYRFRIEGHTDTVGDGRQNLVLSQRRAQAVRAYLAKNYGVSPARLVAVGLGESQLLVATPDQTPEPTNRRVQVLNLGG